MSTESSKRVDYINAEFHVHEKKHIDAKRKHVFKKKLDGVGPVDNRPSTD